MNIKIIPFFEDNYGFVLYDDKTKEAVCIDPPDFLGIDDFLQKNKLQLSTILNTHHHFDHVGGNLELKKKYSCIIYGSHFDKDRIPGIDKDLKEGDKIQLLDQDIEIFFTPGHTLGHIIYSFREQKLAFVGDCLFSFGCGRLFEGSPEQMWESLQKIKRLDPQTQIFCAHEYTLKNINFVLSLKPGDQELEKTAHEIKELRKQGHKTVPFTLGDQLELNPFLTASCPKEFSPMRALRDNF